MELKVNCKTLHQMLTQNIFSFPYEIGVGVHLNITADLNDINSFGYIDEKLRRQMLAIVTGHTVLTTKVTRCYKDVFVSNDDERFRIYVKPIKLPREIKKIK